VISRVFRTYILTILFLTGMLACNKLSESDGNTAFYEVNFNLVAGGSPSGLKDTPECMNEGAAASYIEVTLEKKVEATISKLDADVFYLDGKPYTNSVKLLPGEYIIHDFILKNDQQTPNDKTDDIIIAAAVHQGAPYASLVSSWLNQEFTVSPFKKNVMDMELVCYDEAHFENFGFEYFVISQTVVREVHFFGDICISNLASYYNSPYSAVLGGNQNLLLDLPAIFQIEVFRNDSSMGIFNNNSSSAISLPLTVRYPDRLNKMDSFEFRLSVMVLNNNNIFEYQWFHTWSILDSQSLFSGTDGVVDFVLGNCTTGADLVIPFNGPENHPPVASAVGQTGVTRVGQILTGNYNFFDQDGDTEGSSIYKWYRSDDVNGAGGIQIAGATGITYTLQEADLTKYIRFAVIPVSAGGILQGAEVAATMFSGPVEPAPFSCSNVLTVEHVAGNVAPITKTVSYGTTSGIPGEPSKCWITRNLGASQQAGSKNDATEASAGWYWQFNRKQGFRHDGTSRLPNTNWSNNISESSDWQPGNDPCSLLLGSGWRIPTKTEWMNVKINGSWNNLYSVYNSPLKMHAAGSLKNWGGFLSNRGTDGNYWSNSQAYTESGKFLFISSGSLYINDYGSKASGFSLRCILNNP